MGRLSVNERKKGSGEVRADKSEHAHRKVMWVDNPLNGSHPGTGNGGRGMKESITWGQSPCSLKQEGGIRSRRKSLLCRA